MSGVDGQEGVARPFAPVSPSPVLRPPTRGRAVYLERWRIFLLLRLSLRMRFLRHCCCCWGWFGEKGGGGQHVGLVAVQRSESVCRAAARSRARARSRNSSSALALQVAAAARGALLCCVHRLFLIQRRQTRGGVAARGGRHGAGKHGGRPPAFAQGIVLRSSCCLSSESSGSVLITSYLSDKDSWRGACEAWQRHGRKGCCCCFAHAAFRSSACYLLLLLLLHFSLPSDAS